MIDILYFYRQEHWMHSEVTRKNIGFSYQPQMLRKSKIIKSSWLSILSLFPHLLIWVNFREKLIWLINFLIQRDGLIRLLVILLISMCLERFLVIQKRKGEQFYGEETMNPIKMRKLEKKMKKINKESKSKVRKSYKSFSKYHQTSLFKIFSGKSIRFKCNKICKT